LGHRFKSRLYQFGLISAKDTRAVSERFIDEFLALSIAAQLRDSLETLARQWKSVDREIREYRKKLSEQGRQDPRREARYRSVPGVGPIAARTLANELSDMSRFRNERQLYSFLGLTPSEYSSGENRRLGHISRQGSARLRWILTEAAWRAIKKDPRLGEDYRRIAARAGNKRAIVAIARRLAGRMRACFRKNEDYRTGLPVAA
jgi:transposase